MGSIKKKFQALVIDDSPTVAAALERKLSVFGVETTHVSHYNDLLSVYRDNANFDVIIMDIDMPLVNGDRLATILVGWGWNKGIIYHSDRDDAALEKIVAETVGCYVKKAKSVMQLGVRIHECVKGDCENLNCALHLTKRSKA